jgi:hypothetical protein
MSDKSRKYELECMRLAADCAQLAGDIHARTLKTWFPASDVNSRALESHFLQMAKVWAERAEQGPYGHLGRELN